MYTLYRLFVKMKQNFSYMIVLPHDMQTKLRAASKRPGQKYFPDTRPSLNVLMGVWLTLFSIKWLLLVRRQNFICVLHFVEHSLPYSRVFYVKFQSNQSRGSNWDLVVGRQLTNCANQARPNLPNSICKMVCAYH